MVTNLVFVRKKNIKGREYYYLVKSTRQGKKWKKIERYVGINPPSEKDINCFNQEIDSVKKFLDSKKETLLNIERKYQAWLKSAKTDQLHNYEDEIIIRFTYDTSRIEGLSLTYKDTRLLLQQGITPSQKPIRDIKETENHKKAFLFIKECLGKTITKDFIFELHRLLKEGVSEDAGSFRNANVIVGDLIPIKPSLIEKEINNLLVWLQKNKNLHPLEKAAIFHSIFERIHPFFDGNGRVGRLLLNFIMLKNNFPIIIVQNKNKRRYYTALRRADQGNYLFMVKYLFSELIRQPYLN